jgi:hypothetical protein
MMLRTIRAVLTVAAIVVFGQIAMAQSTIFNIPTTDTVAKGKVYFEFDFFSQMPKFDGSDRVNIYVPRGVVGLGPNLEAGANVSFVHAGGTTNAFLQPDVKWRFVNNDDKGIASAVGAIVYTPLNHRDGVDTYSLLYANVSKKFKSTYGPRIHAGPYGVVGAHDSLFSGAPKAGAIVGYEQPVYSKLSFVADWYSGKNAFGYFTPGISISLPANSLLNAGYSIGNDSYANSNANKNRFLFIYYGVTF